MFTRCHACHTVHPINAELLARGGGKFRCGKCHKINNALEALFDQWPDASQQGTRAGDLPELGITLSLSGRGENPDNPQEAAGGSDASGGPTGYQAPRNAWIRVLWITAAVVLTLVVSFNLALFFNLPVLNHALLQPVLITLGIKQAAKTSPASNAEAIELLARTMEPHPSRPGVLRLTASIVNRADVRQPYPNVDVTLVDIGGRRLSRKLFKPGDYLTRSAELRSGMAPGGHLTFSLEIEDPGNEATGFELQFR